MTNEDILKLAQDAGIVVTGEAVWRLCELVAAAECAPLINEIEALRQDGSRLAVENKSLREKCDDAVEWAEKNCDEVLALRDEIARLTKIIDDARGQT